MDKKIILLTLLLIALFGAGTVAIIFNFAFVAYYPKLSPAISREAEKPAVPWSLPQTLTLKTSGKSWNYTDHKDWTIGNKSAKLESLRINEQLLGDTLLALLEEINQPAQDASLIIVNGRATEFSPDQDGQILDLAKTRLLIKTALQEGQEIVTLPIQEQSPSTTLSNLNNLGIQKLVARGESDFTGSSRSRVHNIEVGASRYRGLIIKPRDEFSFNTYLGPVDAKAGFLPELVIKPEGTVPEFGGGLCQVSSTAFRAAFFGGLPITARRNHSYAVKYYEWISEDRPSAVGLDATIYPGSQDFKFVNDTPGAILVWTRIEGTRLYFDFYGTPDAREVTVDGPHPYDKRSDGSVKSTVSRSVIKNGQSEEVTFNSRYVSPNLYPKIYEYPKPLSPLPDQPSEEASILNLESSL